MRIARHDRRFDYKGWFHDFNLPQLMALGGGKHAPLGKIYDITTFKGYEQFPVKTIRITINKINVGL